MVMMMMMMMTGAHGNNWQYSRTDLHVSHTYCRGHADTSIETEREREGERERERGGGEGEKRKDVQFSSFP